MIHIKVALTPQQAAALVENHILHSGISAKCVGRCQSGNPGGPQVLVLVFEKYYFRNSSRASLTVTLENITGPTNVYGIGSGGGHSALFANDLGAADSFEGMVEQVLKAHMI